MVSAMRSRMSQAQVPHWGLLPQARKTSTGRRAPARTAASTSRSRMARQMQMYILWRPPFRADATYSHPQDKSLGHSGQACLKARLKAWQYILFQLFPQLLVDRVRGLAPEPHHGHFG